MATDIDDDEYVEINSKLEDEVQSLFLRNKNLSKNLYWAGLNQQIQQENVQGWGKVSHTSQLQKKEAVVWPAVPAVLQEEVDWIPSCEEYGLWC